NEPRLGRDPLELRLSEHRLPYDVDPGLDVRLESDRAEHVPQTRIRIDEHPRASLIHVREGQNEKPAEQTDKPRDTQRLPSVSQTPLDVPNDVVEKSSYR